MSKMKIIVFAIAISATVFLENVSGMSSPYRPSIADPICTTDVKICTEYQYLSTGSDGCPECLQCRLTKTACPEGITPIKGQTVVNQCPTYHCPGPVRCTKEMKYCADGQYLGKGASGCRECLPCSIELSSCPVGSTSTRNPAVINQCPSYSCTPLH